jgi:2'-5' RNA ligase
MHSARTPSKVARMLHALALLPPLHIAEPLAAIRARFDVEHAAKTVPHVTLKQPFELPAGVARGELMLLDVTRQVCSEHRTFAIELSEISVFHSQAFGSVVHVKVVLGEALRALHAALVRRLASSELARQTDHGANEQRQFYPHLTLAQGLTRERASLVLRELPACWPGSFLASEVVIGRRDEDGVWHRPHVLALRPDVMEP